MAVGSVLIIDDDDTIRETVRVILEDADYSVLTAANGSAGLDCLRDAPDPLVVLLDLMMPIMSWLDVLRHIHAEPAQAARHAFIIFSAAQAISAHTLASYVPNKRLFNLPKPFDLDKLLGTVKQAMSQLADDASAIS